MESLEAPHLHALSRKPDVALPRAKHAACPFRSVLQDSTGHDEGKVAPSCEPALDAACVSLVCKDYLPSSS